MTLSIPRPTRLGKYDLLARIAKGGMAEIYLARQHGMVGFSRLVAVKRILPHLAEEPQFVHMFMEEARVAALISHPNVVRIYDVGQHESNYFIAMEFINGPSLGVVCKQLRREGLPLPVHVAAEIIAQACEGLHAAHELKDESGQTLNLVHRDMSPHNLILATDGQVKLVDFGIAKAENTAVHTRTGKIKGKYPYMSPEQCRGHFLDRRTDIFSLGIVFYELVSGQPLFRRRSDLMVLKAITEEPIPPPHAVFPDVPEPIGEVIMRCLERDPADRFATAEQVAVEVRRALQQLDLTTSTKTVEEYLASGFQPLLDARAQAISQVLNQHIDGHTPPTVDALGQQEQPSSSAYYADHPVEKPIRPRRHVAGVPLRRAIVISLVVILVAFASGLLYRHLKAPRRPRGPVLYFGLPPSFPAEVGQRELRPFLDYLERHLDRPIELVVTKNYEDLKSMLLAGKLHFASMPPLQFVLARHESPKLWALVTQTYEGARTYQAYIVVRDDSPVQELNDLRNKRFCFVDPGSTSGYLVPRYYLRQRGLDPEKLFASTTFSGDHLAVMRDVVEGKCDAGAIYSGAMLSSVSLGVPSSRLRLLVTTGLLPYDVVCTYPAAPPSLNKALREALLNMVPQRDLGRRILGHTYRIDGFMPPQLEDFALVEQVARAEGMIK